MRPFACGRSLFLVCRRGDKDTEPLPAGATIAPFGPLTLVVASEIPEAWAGYTVEVPKEFYERLGLASNCPVSVTSTISDSGPALASRAIASLASGVGWGVELRAKLTVRTTELQVLVHYGSAYVAALDVDEARRVGLASRKPGHARLCKKCHT